MLTTTTLKPLGFVADQFNVVANQCVSTDLPAHEPAEFTTSCQHILIN